MSSLKQACRIFKRSNIACGLGIYFLKYHKWTQFQINKRRNPLNIYEAISYANRVLNNIPADKSSNVFSEVQQHFVNTYMLKNGMKNKSKRGFVDESFYNQCELWAENFDRLARLDVGFIR